MENLSRTSPRYLKLKEKHPPQALMSLSLFLLPLLPFSLLSSYSEICPHPLFRDMPCFFLASSLSQPSGSLSLPESNPNKKTAPLKISAHFPLTAEPLFPTTLQLPDDTTSPLLPAAGCPPRTRRYAPFFLKNPMSPVKFPLVPQMLS